MHRTCIAQVLSIDVEGAEYAVVNSINFKAVTIRMIVIEKPSEILKVLLFRRGFNMIGPAGGGADHFFLNHRWHHKPIEYTSILDRGQSDRTLAHGPAAGCLLPAACCRLPVGLQHACAAAAVGRDRGGEAHEHTRERARGPPRPDAKNAMIRLGPWSTGGSAWCLPTLSTCWPADRRPRLC